MPSVSTANLENRAPAQEKLEQLHGRIGTAL
jgi:hypothetical protein